MTLIVRNPLGRSYIASVSKCLPGFQCPLVLNVNRGSAWRMGTNRG